MTDVPRLVERIVRLDTRQLEAAVVAERTFTIGLRIVL